MPRRLLTTILLLGLVVLPGVARAAPLEQGEALLQALGGLPSRQYLETIGLDPEGAAQLATAIFSRWAEQPGLQARAQSDLGDLQLLTGRYQEAETSFLAAQAANPALESARTGLAQARTRARIARLAEPHLPYGNQVLRAEPFPVAGAEGLWAVLSATVWPSKPLTRYRSVTLQLFHDSGTELHEVGADLVSDPGLESPAIHSICFHVRDLTGDGTPEIVVWLGTLHASSRPSAVRIYANRPPPLRPVLALDSGSPIWIESLNRSRSYNVGETHPIGWHVPPATQPRWTDIYAWSARDGCFQVANQLFPLSFREWPARLRNLLAQYPADWQLLQHLALAQHLTGQDTEAAATYRQAIAEAERELGRVPSEEQRTFVRAQIRLMRSHLIRMVSPN